MQRRHPGPWKQTSQEASRTPHSDHQSLRNVQNSQAERKWMPCLKSRAGIQTHVSKHSRAEGRENFAFGQTLTPVAPQFLHL